MALMLILLLLHAYIGWRLIPALAFAPALQWALAALLLASWLLMPMALLARRIRRQPLSDRLAWAGVLLMGLFSSLFVLTLLRDVLALPLWMASLWVALPALLGPASALAVPLLAAVFTLWGYVNCVFRTNVTARFGSVTAEFGSVTGHSGDVTAGGFAPA